MDADLEGMSRDQLVVEVKRLRHGIRQHRDSTGNELCWYHRALGSLLPEQSDYLPVIPTGRNFSAVASIPPRTILYCCLRNGEVPLVQT
jgi:hypothetical protein